MHYAYAPTIPLPVRIKAHKGKMWDVDGVLNCMTMCTGVLFFQFPVCIRLSPLCSGYVHICAGQHESAQNVREEHCCRRFTVPIEASIFRYPRWSPPRMQRASQASMHMPGKGNQTDPVATIISCCGRCDTFVQLHETLDSLAVCYTPPRSLIMNRICDLMSPAHSHCSCSRPTSTSATVF
jgi:hypothetical protein